MTEETGPGPRTRTVVLSAALVPILIAFAFLAVFHQVNQPTPGPAQPGEGQMISDRNDRMVRAHAVAQSAFVVLGVWLVPRRRRTRAWFLLVAIPVAAAAYCLSYLSLIAG